MCSVWRVGNPTRREGGIVAKTTKPLAILAHPDLAEFLAEEADRGHTVHIDDAVCALSGYDLVLGPNCWRMTPDLIKHKALAIKAGRKAKEGKK